ncbi:MAG: carbohydrate ABC transporter permease [Clostridiales Family XIII bacterium]|nr:carbohydrate ABC transporter permease [Clostridiales Family XIII bacterium]
MRTIFLIILFGFVVCCMFPIIWTVMTSFKTRADFLVYPPLFVFQPTLENYMEVFRESDFVKAFGNSIIICLGVVGCSLLLGVPCAYGLSRFRFKGKGNIAFLILSMRFAPAVVVLIPMFMIYSKLKLINTYPGMILIYMLVNLPLVIWVMYGFFKDIPKDIEEAGLVDGAAPAYIFWRIVTPLVLPGLAATAILTLIFTWNELMFALMLTGKDTQTIPLAIYKFLSYTEISWGPLSASSVIAILPVTVFTLLCQKYLVSGLTFGALKE